VISEAAVRWDWRADPSPPEPRAAVAWHATSRSLHARLAQLPTARQEKLFLSASDEVLIVSGAPEDLPWVPGIAYATRCEEAPTLWRPTWLQPDVPLDLLARSLKRQHAREPVLLWHDPAAVVPLDHEQRVTPDLLAQIAERWRAA
jgi:hypothetical protein